MFGDGDGGLYRLPSPTRPSTFSSGCSLLDQVLGGGWAHPKILNVIGDRSTGKTLLAIEASANFVRAGKKRIVRYLDCEAAFDRGYAESVGLPLDVVELPNDPDKKNETPVIDTVEDLFEDLDRTVATAKKDGRHRLYVIDSLDAITSAAEEARDIRTESFGTDKAKKMSALFRRRVRRLRESNITLMVISQVRDKVGAMFGRKITRSGGRALDFYAYQILELAQIKKLKKTLGGVDRFVGIQVKAQCTKNKLADPYREAEFPIIFGYGVEDVIAGIEWLKVVGELKPLLPDLNPEKTLRRLDQLTVEEYVALRASIAGAVATAWKKIEQGFHSGRRKYG